MSLPSLEIGRSLAHVAELLEEDNTDLPAAARPAPRAANALADDVGLQLRLPHLARGQACASRGQCLG